MHEVRSSQIEPWQKERRSITLCHFLAAPDMLYFSESVSKGASYDIWVDTSEIRRVSDPVARLRKSDLVSGH